MRDPYAWFDLRTFDEISDPGRASKYHADKALYALLNRIASAWGFDVSDLTGGRKTKKLVLARQEFMATAYSTGRYSYPTIGRVILRDHSTVIHGVKAYRARLA